MANPQIERGHIRIATGTPLNDLYTAMIFLTITKPTWGVLAWYIGRLTWGWGTKERETNWQAIATRLGYTKQTVKENLAEMEAKGIVKVKILLNSQERFIVSINKNFELWQLDEPFKGLLKAFITSKDFK